MIKAIAADYANPNVIYVATLLNPATGAGSVAQQIRQLQKTRLTFTFIAQQADDGLVGPRSVELFNAEEVASSTVSPAWQAIGSVTNAQAVDKQPATGQSFAEFWQRIPQLP